MSLQLPLAILALPATLFASYWAIRREYARLALGLIVATPLIVASTYVAVGLLATPSIKATAIEPTGATSSAAALNEPATVASPAASTGGGRVAELRAKAEDARRAKNYVEATARFREVTQAAPFDPDGWADLGDAQAAAAGGNLSAGQAAIDRALELDPTHPKALWLKASAELESKHFAAAADLWRRLLRVLPTDSSDAKIVQSNLDESERLAGSAGAKR